MHGWQNGMRLDRHSALIKTMLPVEIFACELVLFLFVWKVVCPQKNSCFEIRNRSTTCRTWIFHPMQSIRNPVDLYFSCVHWEVPSSKYVLMLQFGASKHKAVRKYPYFNFDVGVLPYGKLTPCYEMFKKLPNNPFNYIFYLYMYTAKTSTNIQ